MQYEVSFGRVGRPQKAVGGAQKFRLAVLGDFSGRANAGLMETGEKLARRKPIAVDVDNLDDVLERMGLTLRLPLDEGTAVEVKLASLDDFHPDQLVENVGLFETLLQLRRDLGSKAGFARASKEVLSWSGEQALPPPERSARGVDIATDKKLSDFARLTGRAKTKSAETDVDDLVRRLVGPFVQPLRDSRQEDLTARVDAALSAAMRRVLHHPDFQTAEALWRSVEFLVRRIETGAKLQIVLYDVSAEEWAADLAATDALDATGLYGMLVEQPGLDANQGPLSAVIGLYGFELSPPHADLLGRMAQIAAAAGAPFVTSIEPDALQTPMHEQNPLIRDAWTALEALPAAAYLGAATVRFLVRMPYGKKSDPIDAFAFEEFTREAGLSSMLWANPAVAAGLLLAQGWLRSGPKMQPGAANVIGDMPYYVYTAPDGDQVALPCTERLYGERQVAKAAPYNVMPVICLRGRPEIRMAGFNSVAGTPLAGFWAPVKIAPAAQPAAPGTAAEVQPKPAEDPGPETAAATPPETATTQTAAEPEAAEVDLDALLASLSEPAPAAAEGETEVDLDALLASL
jgi:type VI secretion system protein ImpC